MKRLGIVLIISGFYLTGSAEAAGSFYLTLGPGVTIPTRNSSSNNSSRPLLEGSGTGVSEITLYNVNWKNLYQTGYEFNVAFGRHIYQNARIEGEFVYQNLRRQIKGSYDWIESNRLSGNLFTGEYGNIIGTTYTRAKVFSFLLNGLYDFKNSSKWTPFLGLGVGVAWINSRSTYVNGTLGFNDVTAGISGTVKTLLNSPTLTGPAFAAQFKLGLDYHITDHVALTALYRFLITTTFKSTGSYITTNAGSTAAGVFNVPGKAILGVTNNGIDVNFTYTF